MPNIRLQAAMDAASLTIEQIAAQVDVDPKTVERWVNADGRTPHRTTRQRVAALLRVEETHLWPANPRQPSAPTNGVAELIHLYPSRSAVPFALWTELIHEVREAMDVLVFSGQFLVEQHNILPVVRAKAAEGVRFRFVVGDHTSPAVIQRAEEEGTTGGLEGRIQMMRRYLQDVAGLPGVEVRTHGTILYNSIYRFDDQALINGHAFGSLAGQNPMLHIRRLDGGSLWEHYMRSFERVWEIADPEPPGR
ncbi:helix-turn-helix domain-containing protein [Pseudonocardia sp. RS11V-5]|uniref:helix-turn-helix domain-containing protein n=1 Tax=Pseudonocardia terrae TaxID=2905831 RepID=UPI001E5A7C33|nr:helix-turn-helix domain-containing protein [Pseudonocardia terrae]MCE3551350.1 helix-turn-helix domain-containing protein [Pseudonocardia terrae]